MPILTLLIDDSDTQTMTLSRTPCIGEYIFFKNHTLSVERVIHIPKLIGSQALISVHCVETASPLPA